MRDTPVAAVRAEPPFGAVGVSEALVTAVYLTVALLVVPLAMGRYLRGRGRGR